MGLIRLDCPRSLLFAIPLFLCGCGAGETLGVSVSGSVDVNGDPLSCATISWLPQNGTRGAKQTVLVHEGQYEVQPSQGMFPGWYRVRITMLPPNVIEMAVKDDPGMSKFQGQVISHQFDSRSTIAQELVAEQENKYDFSVTFID